MFNATPQPLYPGKETRYPIYRWPGRSQNQSGRSQKASFPPGFDPRSFQPVTSRCTDSDIRAHHVTRATHRMMECFFFCRSKRCWEISGAFSQHLHRETEEGHETFQDSRCSGRDMKRALLELTQPEYTYSVSLEKWN